MARYRIGDKVLIKKDLVNRRYYGNIVYLNAMYIKGPVTIREVHSSKYYFIYEKKSYLYSEDMFEPYTALNIFPLPEQINKSILTKIKEYLFSSKSKKTIPLILNVNKHKRKILFNFSEYG